MRIWLLSDLHLEMSVWDIPADRPQFDVLVVAGDLITRAERGVQWLLDRFPNSHVIYVLGNHERYGTDAVATLDKARLAAKGSTVHVLVNDAVEIGGVEFLGATLWTDFTLHGNDTAPEAMRAAEARMNDYRTIRIDGYPKALVRFVECRAILGGVTTTQGILYQNGTPMRSYYEGLVRNVEFPVKNWPVADDYINDFTSVQDAENRAGPALAAGTPYIIHLCEGVDSATQAKFDYLQKGDGTWLIGPPLVAIHGVALDDPQFRTLAQNRVGGLVWSPLSNMLLYGATTKVARAKAAGVRIAIGSDWAPSGTKNLLGELKIARHVSDHEGGIFSDQELVDAVTRTPAAMLGWTPYVGSIEAKKTADLMIIDTAGGDPYRELIDADESSVIAVIIDGRPRAGRATVIDPGSAGVELIRIARQNLVLDIIESNTHPLGGTSLSSAITTMTYALANLPDVAREAHALAPMMKDQVDVWRPVPDYDDRSHGPMFAAPTLPGPDDVDPLAIEPMTAVDDVGFAARIKANPNVPKWLKDAL